MSSIDIKFDRYTTLSTQLALDAIKSDYESSLSQHGNLIYHNTRHTKEVISRGRQITEVIRLHAPVALGARDPQLIEIACAYHDINQDWNVNTVNTPFGVALKRQRMAPFIEQKSALRATIFMHLVNDTEGIEIFQPDNIQAVKDAIEATIINIDQSAGTISQPNLKSSSPITTVVTALADLNAAAMEPPQVILRDTDTLFLEDNLDFEGAIQEIDKIDNQSKNAFKERIMDWHSRQLKFIVGRKKSLPEELLAIPEQARIPVTQLFLGIDQSIDLLKKTISLRSEMSLKELVGNMNLL